MTVRTWVGVFLALQHCSNEADAEALISTLASPQTRELARREWREMYSHTVVRLEAVL